MRDYHEACRSFSIEDFAREVLGASLDSELNAYVLCCARWADSDRVALRWMGGDGQKRDVTYREFDAASARFANLLKARGIKAGDVVAGMLPRIPEILVAVLGTWRIGAVYQPLFTAFGAAAVQSRVVDPGGSGAKLIVVDAANRSKLDEVPDCPPVLTWRRGAAARATDGDFEAEMAVQSADCPPVMRRRDDPFVILFTSGTTGKPKGIAYPLFAFLQFAMYMRAGLDLQESDIYWCFADPGWALGMIGTLTAPLLLGCTTVMYEGPFSVESTVNVVKELGVTSMVAAPTVFRMMRVAGAEAVAPMRGALRAIASGGEPLNPELNRWAADALAAPIHEIYGQSEMGVNFMNHHGLRHEARVGSVGLVSPGMSYAILDDALNPVPQGQTGVLAIDRSASPLFFFTGYWKAQTPSFQGKWYLTGDVMKQDEDGYLYFNGRNDDIITSAGYRIGPSDVENILIEHESVAEAAVVGKPDPERTEIVKAFVVLRGDYEATEALADELRQLVRRRLSTHAYPREISFETELPKNPAGKVLRYVLRQRA
ncbi:MAG: AMP-binding protein [Alphaproteobacteria bacterium]|nr:AMP-binding protein [Alphaproteobacteria bacterium]